MKTNSIIFRVEPEVKEAAEAVFSDIGLSMSAALSLFLKQSIKLQSLPFSLESSMPQVQEVPQVAYGSTSPSDLITMIRMIQDTASQFDIDHVILFGSYATNSVNRHSDVDLYMESSIDGLEYFGVAEAFRQATGKKVDLFSNKTIVPDSTIAKEIKKNGVKIYQRSS